MSANLPQYGEIIIENGKATLNLHNFFEDLAESNNYTVATVPDVILNEGKLIYVADETGGATMAFSDGTNWRRVQDRAIIG